MNKEKFAEVKISEDRMAKVTSIIASGVYEYLKASGLLKSDVNRTKRIKDILSENKKILTAEYTDSDDMY